MKIYTEEDVLKMLRSFHTSEFNVQLSIHKLTPIQLPSDEEIEKIAKEYVLYNESKRNWVIEGMKLYKKMIKNK